MKFADVLEGRLQDLKVVIHCDAGSIETVEKSKSQIGVLGMAQSKFAKVTHPEDSFRGPDIMKARMLVKCYPYLRDVPVFRPSGRSERVAVSSFAAELQAIYCAFGAGTILRRLYSELLQGHSRGHIQVEIRNDQLSVIDAWNGSNAIPTDRKMAGALRGIREMLERNEIDSLLYVQGKLNLADALTESAPGNELFHLITHNKCAASTPSEKHDKWQVAAAKRRYLTLDEKSDKLEKGKGETKTK